MYAIIRDGQGGYYTSTVFGYYCPLSSNNRRKRHLERIYNQFFVVLSEDKKRLVKKEVFSKRKNCLDPLVLIVDEEHTGWIVDQEGYGCLDFLTGIDFESGQVVCELEPELLKRCIEMDSAYVYQEYQEVRTEAELRNLFCAAGGFHDAFLERCQQDGDQIYVLFGGIWGCQVELWFEGDAACSVEARNPLTHDPNWFTATLVKENGFYYLIDDESADANQLDRYDCWFKARKLRYHVIPNP